MERVMNQIKTVTIVALLAILSTSAKAVLIDFDDANNGANSYSSGGFDFAPTNFTSGNCAPAASGNGSCFLEDSAGATVMTRTGGGVFTLNSFWFQLLGNGNPTILRIENNTNQVLDFTVGLTAPDVTLFSDDSDVLGNLASNTEYVATLTTMAFMDITSVSFDQIGGGSSGNFRVDCIVATYAGASADTGGGHCGLDAPSPVPVPAAVWLFGTAMIGFIGLSKRKKV
jgi:hypothetical protein